MWRQVEVGNSPSMRGSDTRVNEQVRLAGPGAQLAGSCHAFQDTHTRRTNSDDTAAARPAGRHRSDGGGGQFAPFAVQRMPADVFRLHRLKRAQADVQGYRCAIEPRSLSRANTPAVKCKPAVGAATAPSRRA